MLAHCDLLVAVWDEGEAAGIGGTGAIVEQAVSEGAPVLLINPASPGQVRLLWTGDLELPPGKMRIEDLPQREALALLPAVVAALVGAAGRRPRPGRPARLLSAAGRALARLADVFDLPVDAGRAGPALERFRRAEGRTMSAAAGLARRASPTRSRRIPCRPRSCAGPCCRRSRPATGWRCATANSIARPSCSTSSPRRSRCRWPCWAWSPNCPGAAAGDRPAGGQGGAGGAGDRPDLRCILGVWRVGARRHWHERWLNYRRAAEWLRHLRILTLVGARSPITRPRQPPESVGERARRARLEQDDWVGWYVRSVERLLPLPNRVTDETYLSRGARGGDRGRAQRSDRLSPRQPPSDGGRGPPSAPQRRLAVHRAGGRRRGLPGRRAASRR